MSRHTIATAFLLLSLTALGACSQPAPPADNTGADNAANTTSAPIPEKTAMADATHVEEGVTFSVEPANVYACEGRDRTTSLIKWNVQRPEVKSIKVLISDATNPEKKTLAAMAPVGEAKTGAWVVAGLQVELVDADSGKQLASHTVSALPCN